MGGGVKGRLNNVKKTDNLVFRCFPKVVLCCPCWQKMMTLVRWQQPSGQKQLLLPFISIKEVALSPVLFLMMVRSDSNGAWRRRDDTLKASWETISMPERWWWKWLWARKWPSVLADITWSRPASSLLTLPKERWRNAGSWPKHQKDHLELSVRRVSLCLRLTLFWPKGDADRAWDALGITRPEVAEFLVQ